mgnify:CR=1 FL=1
MAVGYTGTTVTTIRQLAVLTPLTQESGSATQTASPDIVSALWQPVAPTISLKNVNSPDAVSALWQPVAPTIALKNVTSPDAVSALWQPVAPTVLNITVGTPQALSGLWGIATPTVTNHLTSRTILTSSVSASWSIGQPLVVNHENSPSETRLISISIKGGSSKTEVSVDMQGSTNVSLTGGSSRNLTL